MNANEQQICTVLEKLYIKYKNRFLSEAYLIVQDRVWAEDIVQSTMLHIIECENMGKIVCYSEKQLFHLILTVISWFSQNELRKRKYLWNYMKKQKELLMSEVQFTDNIEKYFYDMTYEESREFLKVLPEESVQIMYMRFVLELSVQEISQLLRLKEKTTQKRIERCRKKMQVYIKEHRPDLLSKLIFTKDT